MYSPNDSLTEKYYSYIYKLTTSMVTVKTGKWESFIIATGR